MAGLLVGSMTGLFGVGGGFLIVPTLAVALAFSMRMADGTSLVIITATSLMALSAHLAAGRTLDVGVTATMTVSPNAGALAGVRLAERVPQRQLGQGFAPSRRPRRVPTHLSDPPRRSPRHNLRARFRSRCLFAIGCTAVGPRSDWR
jgi:Sulfite exporter TauE/SafE